MCIFGKKSKKKKGKKSKKSSFSSFRKDSNSNPDLKSKTQLELTTSPSAQTPTPATKRTTEKSIASSKEKDEVAMANLKSIDASMDKNAVKIMFEKKKKPSSKVERKIGDVNFSTLGALANSERAEDDTKMEKNGKKRKGAKKIAVGNNEAVSITTVEEQDFDAPNEENYMANLLDMDYVVHDIMRLMTKQKAGDPTSHEKANPYGELENLDDPKLFNWNVLRSHTYLTNANMLPTQEEAEHVPTIKEGPESIQFRLPPLDLTAFVASLKTEKTNIETASTVEVKSKENLKTVQRPVSKVLSVDL